MENLEKYNWFGENLLIHENHSYWIFKVKNPKSQSRNFLSFWCHESPVSFPEILENFHMKFKISIPFISSNSDFLYSQKLMINILLNFEIPKKKIILKPPYDKKNGFWMSRYVKFRTWNYHKQKWLSHPYKNKNKNRFWSFSVKYRLGIQFSLKMWRKRGSCAAWVIWLTFYLIYFI